MENKAAKSTVMNVTNELTVACVKKSTSHSQNIISPIIIRHFPKLQLEKTIAIKGKQNLAFQPGLGFFQKKLVSSSTLEETG